jgi:arsenate reductase (glutaredoxin)
VSLQRGAGWAACFGRSLMPVQIFGTKKNAATRKAERFFAERRIPVHFVDLAERGASRGELQRFVQKFGIEALVDRTSRRFQELGLGPARYGAERWLDILIGEPLLLVQPLVRNGGQLTVGGASESDWKAWIAAGIT